VGVGGQTERRLRKLGVMEKVSSQNIISDRVEALRQAVNYVDEHIVDFGRGDTIDSQAIA
jgi:sulfate permease, SulP family